MAATHTPLGLLLLLLHSSWGECVLFMGLRVPSFGSGVVFLFGLRRHRLTRASGWLAGGGVCTNLFGGTDRLIHERIKYENCVYLLRQEPGINKQ